MQIVISAAISTAISFIILNFGEDIMDKARDAVDGIREWLAKGGEQEGGNE